MNELIKHPVTAVWLLLVVATGASWWMGTGVEAGVNTQLVSSTLIIVAFIKVRFVIRYFMEVREAPVALKLASDLWLVLVPTTILTLYWQVI